MDEAELMALVQSRQYARCEKLGGRVPQAIAAVGTLSAELTVTTEELHGLLDQFVFRVQMENVSKVPGWRSVCGPTCISRRGVRTPCAA